MLSSEGIRKATVKPGTPNSDHERSVLDADVALFSAVVGQTPVVQLAWASFWTPWVTGTAVTSL